jgi:hypothetical protein
MTRRRIPKAHSISMEMCTCGCGFVNVYLHDEKEREFACFSLGEDQWLPFAQDAVRIYRGQEPLGPNHAAVMQ